MYISQAFSNIINLRLSLMKDVTQYKLEQASKLTHFNFS